MISLPSVLMEVTITYILYLYKDSIDIYCRFLVKPFGFSVGMTYLGDMIFYTFAVTDPLRMTDLG